MISFVDGTVKAHNEEAMKHLRAMPSFLGFTCVPDVGTQITKTVDCFSTIGAVLLAGKDKAEVMKDIELVRKYEREILIVE